jgi:hypothetical protein
VNLRSQLSDSATLDRFDLKTDLLPRIEWLPSNIAFHNLDVFEPIPEEFVGKYDIVHIRFFMPVVQNNDPLPILKNVIKLLSMQLWLVFSSLADMIPRAWRLLAVG